MNPSYEYIHLVFTIFEIFGAPDKTLDNKFNVHNDIWFIISYFKWWKLEFKHQNACSIYSYNHHIVSLNLLIILNRFSIFSLSILKHIINYKKIKRWIKKNYIKYALKRTKNRCISVIRQNLIYIFSWSIYIYFMHCIPNWLHVNQFVFFSTSKCIENTYFINEVSMLVI